MSRRSRPHFARASLVTMLALTVATMLPVTAVVPILRGLVQDRYQTGAFATSLFMSINMIGALCAAPLLGWLSDRTGKTGTILVLCAGADAALWWLLSLTPPFPLFLGLRLLEGAAHIGALSMLMAAVSRSSMEGKKRARMAAMGGSVIFGVALGAPLGGIVGRSDPLVPLQLGVVVMIAVALLALFFVHNGPKASGSELSPWPKIHAPKSLRLPYLFGFVDRLTIGIFVVTFSLFAADLGLSPAESGLHVGAFMMTFTALSYPAGRLATRVGMWPMVLAGSLGYGLAYATIPWLQGGLLWAAMVVCGAFSAVMFGPNLMLVVRGSSEQTRASAMAGFNAAGSVGFLIGPLLAGAALQLMSQRDQDVAYRAVFGATGAVELAVVLFVLAGALRARRAGQTLSGWG